MNHTHDYRLQKSPSMSREVPGILRAPGEQMMFQEIYTNIFSRQMEAIPFIIRQYLCNKWEKMFTKNFT